MNIHASIERVLTSQKIVGELFYEEFLEGFPEVQKHFHGVNMQRQAVLLTMALIVVEQFYSHPYAATRKFLQYLGSKHHEMQIPTELYGKWAEAMIATLKKFHGDDWNSDVEKEWSEAIDKTTEIMFDGYEQRFTV